MSREHINFETKKSLHISLTRETHAAFRMLTFQYHLSMQEVFEELANQIVEKQPHMVALLDDLANRKRLRQTKKFSATDAESIFKVIAEENPMEKPADSGDAEDD